MSVFDLFGRKGGNPTGQLARGRDFFAHEFEDGYLVNVIKMMGRAYTAEREVNINANIEECLSLYLRLIDEANKRGISYI